MSRPARPALDDEGVRSAKERLIAEGLLRTVDAGPLWVPEDIDRSWRRSISAGVDRSAAAFRYLNDFDTDSELVRAATPVLDRLAETLQDMGTAVFLADRSGQIVARRVSTSGERNRFDNASAAEGFDFSEESVGTNGLGTPIQEGGSVFVRGAQHFNAGLEHLACAGVGIRHPVTGRVIGSLSLAAPADTAEMMMLAMTRAGAQQIVDNLSATLARREITLGRSYQQRRAKGPVIVLNSDTVMTNVTGLSFLDVGMHARLWDSLLAQDWGEGPRLLDLDLDDLRAKVLAHRLQDDDDPAFAVEILDRRTDSASAPPRRRSGGDPFVDQLQRIAARSASPLAVTGPTGSGKLHVALSWLEREGRADALLLDGSHLADDESWRRRATEALDEGKVVVLRRLEDLSEADLSAVKSLADRTTDGRLVLTVDKERASEPVRRVLSQVALGVEVPPLAARRQEIPDIVKKLLDGIEPERRPLVSAASLQVLVRWDWPGNVAELRQVLRSLAADLPAQPVHPYHLPEQMWEAANRRPLSRMEAAERAEIVAALRQCEGNRSQAAKLLGIGRTTLYRKLESLGIDESLLA